MAEILQFSQHDLHMLKEETVYKGHFELKKCTFAINYFPAK
ncbi:putative ADP-ribose pyrophosphatase [Actinobacillus equuli]|nr:putative ADP-ribose pyrophosphatase [Actinobacillus equuli]